MKKLAVLNPLCSYHTDILNKNFVLIYHRIRNSFYSIPFCTTHTKKVVLKNDAFCLAKLLKHFQAVTIFNGGVKINVVPSDARAFINFRIHPAQTLDEVVEHVRDVIDDDRVSVAIVESFLPSRVTDYSSGAINFQIVVNSALEVITFDQFKFIIGR